MKLRIKGDTIRLRLTRSEVAAVGRGERVEETTTFAPGATLRYAVATGEGGEVRASLDGTSLVVVLPRDEAARWAEGEEVGLSGTQPNGRDGGASLAILVEKDFACLDRRDDDADAFPNPAAAGGRC